MFIPVEEQKILKHIDKAYVRDCAKCANWPEEIRISRIARLQVRRDTARDRVFDRVEAR